MVKVSIFCFIFYEISVLWFFLSDIMILIYLVLNETRIYFMN